MSAGYDYIIVGSGAAGSVLASRLSETRDARILLLEQGRRDKSWLLRLPTGFIKMIGGHRDVHIQESVPQPQIGGRVQTIPQGEVLGGSTSVNAMVYMRGRAGDYDNWAELTGDAGWNWQSMLARFKKQEGNVRLNDEFHNPHGPLKVSDSRHFAEASYRFVQAMQELGYPLVNDFNRGSPNGVGFMQYTIDNARRCSAVDAHLRPVMARPNLEVSISTKVIGLLIEKGRAIGVRLRTASGKIRETRADCEVILAAGSFNSPKLLMLAGIGDPDHLRSHGIGVQSPLPGVGRNLQDHHEVPLLASTRRQLGYFGEDKGIRMLVNGIQYLLFRSGPVSTIGVEATAFTMPDETGDPVMQIYCIPTVYIDRDVAGFKPTAGVTLNANLLRPKARGEVKLHSTNPDDPPLVNPNYLGHEQDLEREINGVRFLREIFKTSVFRDEVAEELLPGKKVRSTEELAEHCRRTVKTGYHPVGTCKMGKDTDDTAVVTPDLRVRGIESLRVVDASVMPVIVSANTNAPTQALADRGADLIIAEA